MSPDLRGLNVLNDVITLKVCQGCHREGTQMNFFLSDKVFKLFSALMMVFTALAVLFASEVMKIALIIALILYIIYVILNRIFCYIARKNSKNTKE